MATALDLLETLPGPAALVAADGAVEGNAAFRELTEPPALTQAAAEGWNATRLPDGTILWRAHLARAAETEMAARERFLATMSHEIRTPLNGVLGMAGLLARTKLDAAQTSYLRALTESGEHLLALVGDILDYAKLDADALEFEPSPVDVEALLQSVCELLSPRAHARGLEIAWAVAPDLPTVIADEGRLRQIVFNLAGNALKFTETGGVLLSAETEPAGPGLCDLRLVVADTGPGIAPADRERVFNAFAQAEGGALAGGTGLGLAIVRRLTEAFGGEVTLDSAPGAGATFTFAARLPVADAPCADQTLAGRAVSVISPSAIVREAAVRQMQSCGGRAEAHDSLGADHATGAVLLIDHACRGTGRLAPRPRRRTALILLAPEERDLIGRYRAAGYAGYLIKPLRRASLAARVLAADGEAPPDDETPAAEDERAALPAAAGLRVLLAEDNPVNALLAVTLLRREGCVVDKVADGHEALAALAAAPYDLVLMDMRMPGLDGPAATRAYRARGGTAPVVALTANAFEEDRRACLAAGMNDFLTKPLDPAALRAAVSRWTRIKTQVRLAG